MQIVLKLDTKTKSEINQKGPTERNAIEPYFFHFIN